MKCVALVIVAVVALAATVAQADRSKVQDFIWQKMDTLPATDSIDVLVHFSKRFDRDALVAAENDIEKRAHSLVFGLIDVGDAAKAWFHATVSAPNAPAVSIGQCFWISPMCELSIGANDVSTLEHLASFDAVEAIYWNGQHALTIVDRFEEMVAVVDESDDDIEWNIEFVSAPSLWKHGVNGTGITVAVCDTGVQWTHPALINHYRGQAADGSVDHDYNWYDASAGNKSATPIDDQGHGTHCTGTAVGGVSGHRIGAAPGAKWIGCKNMEKGFGSPSSYIGCLQFITAPTKVDGSDPKPELRPHVSSHSYGCPAVEGCSPDSLHDAVKNVVAAGVYFSAAAGNAGPVCKSVADPPGIYAEVTSVAALKKLSDSVALFSSRGPTPEANLDKPDISAPGSAIVSSYPPSKYASLSGTSMATPLVAGIVALQWSAEPMLVRNIDLTNTNLFSTAQTRDSDLCVISRRSVADAASSPSSSSSSSSPFDADLPPKNEVYGYGIADAFRAVVEPTLPD
jgi:serine protease AprX